MRSLVLRVALCVAVLLPLAARAQSAPIDVDPFRPTFDGRGLFGVEGAGGHRWGEFGAGLFLNFTRYLLRPESTQPADPGALEVQGRLTATVLGSVGFTKWLSFGFALPVSVQNLLADAEKSINFPGLGMIWLLPKFRLMREESHGFGISVITGLALPSGRDDAFLGQSGVVFQPMLLLEKSAGPVRFLLNFGARIRESTRYLNLEVGHQLDLRFGVGWRAHDRLELGAEVMSTTQASAPFGSSVAGTAAEVLLGAKLYPGNDWQLFLGAGPGLTRNVGAPSVRAFAGFMYAPHDPDADGDGVPDRYDRCPRERGPASNRGCPEVVEEPRPRAAPPSPRKPAFAPGDVTFDADGDGIPDSEDACPLVKGPRENRGCPWPDRDGDGTPDIRDKCPDLPGPKENAGCPWPDSDGDGIPDKDDDCPMQPGTAGGRGCPKSDVQLTRCEVRITKQVRFKTGSAAIVGGSHALLDEVAGVLREYAQIKRVEVQGHTDDVGSARANLRLSKRRAASVRGYLVRKGVDASRVEAKGYGSSVPLVPIADGTSVADKKAARVQNRRVQFVILESAMSADCPRK